MNTVILARAHTHRATSRHWNLRQLRRRSSRFTPSHQGLPSLCAALVRDLLKWTLYNPQRLWDAAAHGSTSAGCEYVFCACWGDAGESVGAPLFWGGGTPWCPTESPLKNGEVFHSVCLQLTSPGLIGRIWSFETDAAHFRHSFNFHSRLL